MPQRLQQARRSILAAGQLCADMASELDMLETNWQHFTKEQQTQYCNGVIAQCNRLELHADAVRRHVRGVI